MEIVNGIDNRVVTASCSVNKDKVKERKFKEGVVIAGDLKP